MGLMAALVCWALALQGQAPDEARIRQLIDQLGADFLEEREPARLALEKIGKPAEPLLLGALANPDYRVRRACLDLLTTLKSSTARARAFELFSGDDDPSVRESAFRLLQALGPEAEEALIAVLGSLVPEYRRGALQSLLEMKSQKCAAKVSDLYDREPEKGVKEAAFKCMLGLGKAAEPFLLKHLNDQDALIRRDCLSGLRGSDSAEVMAAVARQFAQETEEAALHQAWDFLQRAGAAAEPTFLAGLKSPRPGTRLKSILGLKAIKSTNAVDPVAEVFLSECPPDVRGAAAEYLRAQGARSEDALLRGLANKEPVVRLESIRTLGEIESLKALEPIASLFREEKNKELHERCFDFFRRLGIRAEKELIGALDDEDKDIRCLAVTALGDAQSLRAIPRLIAFMTELDPKVKDASESALASIGPKALAEVAKAVASGRLKKASAEIIESYYARGEVERLLEDQFGDDESTGFFEGQFKELVALGREKAVPVLIRILNDRTYVYRRIHRHEPKRFQTTMTELAVMALGEIGGEGALDALKTFAQNVARSQATERIQEETLVALYRQGEKQPLENFLRETRLSADSLLTKETADQQVSGCSGLFSLGLLYTRLKRYAEAESVYHELGRAIETNKLETARQRYLHTMYYNLACLTALQGDRKKAIEWLEKGVRAGFTDRAWIKKDGDLDSIRNEDGYKKIIGDDSLFDKKPGEEPPGDR